MKPYLIISDIHAHAWSAFSTPTPLGVNGRLQMILDEIARACDELYKRGGRHVVVSGDLFHVRGNIAPSVLIPTMDVFRRMIDMGMTFHIIPGNHDLEGKDSKRLTSAVAALEQHGCHVYHEPQTVDLDGQLVRMVPWFDSVADLRGELETFCQDAHAAGESWADTDLILHAPINGVIPGIPDHGLDPAELNALGFKNVFAGHYHNHKRFEQTSVYSVGAIAHHTWSDVGSQAGFLIVGDTVDFYPSHLPKFVDITENTRADDVPSLVRGNYARVRVETTKGSDIEKMRDYLTKAGARGTVVISTKKPDVERTGAVQVTAGSTVESTVASFVRGMGSAFTDEVERAALRVLAEAEVTA